MNSTLEWANFSTTVSIHIRGFTTVISRYDISLIVQRIVAYVYVIRFADYLKLAVGWNE